MILCDTNVLIRAISSYTDTRAELQRIGEDNIVLPALVVMELYQGMQNKAELRQMQLRLARYPVLHLGEAASKSATALLETYTLSHGLQMPDALIAATALWADLPLFTYNTKDFRYIPNIQLHPLPELT